MITKNTVIEVVGCGQKVTIRCDKPTPRIAFSGGVKDADGRMVGTPAGLAELARFAEEILEAVAKCKAELS